MSQNSNFFTPIDLISSLAELQQVMARALEAVLQHDGGDCGLAIGMLSDFEKTCQAINRIDQEARRG